MAGKASGGSISARAMTRGAGEEGTDWRRKQQLGLVFQVVWRAVANRRWVDSPCRSSGCPRRDVLWRLCVIRGMFRMMRYLGSSRGSHRSRYRGDDGRASTDFKTISLFGPSAHLFSLTLPPRASALPPLRRYRTQAEGSLACRWIRYPRSRGRRCVVASLGSEKSEEGPRKERLK